MDRMDYLKDKHFLFFEKLGMTIERQKDNPDADEILYEVKYVQNEEELREVLKKFEDVECQAIPEN